MGKALRKSRSDLHKGSVVNGYRLVKLLPDGGYAVVWKAQSIHVADDVAALKIVPRRMGDLSEEETKEIVLREARLMCKLADRARVPRYKSCQEFQSDPPAGEYGWTLAMEFVEGNSLHDRLGKLLSGYLLDREFPVGTVRPSRLQSAVNYADYLRDHLLWIVDLFIDASRTVEVLHEEKRLHLDIKPRNIQLKEEKSGDIPYLLDFNVGRFMGDPGPAARGTFEYASNEQYSGAPLDMRSDVYSLGASLYHALCLVPPYCDLGADLEPVRRTRRRGKPLRPVQKINPHVDGCLAGIVAKAMASDPVQRFASAAEFRAALENWRLGAVNPASGSQRVELPSALARFGEVLQARAELASAAHDAVVIPFAEVRQRDAGPHLWRLVQEGVLSPDPRGFRLTVLGRGAAHHFSEQNQREPLEKHAIGHAVGWLLARRKHRVVAVDGGSTALWVLRALTFRDLAGLHVPIQIQTTNLLALREIAGLSLRTHWHVLPGTLRCETGVLVDQVVKGLQDMNVSPHAAIIGINQFDADTGAVGTNLHNEREIKEELIQRAIDEVIVTLNPEKLGRGASAPLKDAANLPALLAGAKQKVTIITARPVRYHDGTQANLAAANAHHQRVLDFLGNLQRFLSAHPGKFRLRLFRVPILLERPDDLLVSEPEWIDPGSPAWLSDRLNRFQQEAFQDSNLADEAVLALALESWPQ